METIDLKSLRKSTGLNQQQFWAAVNVTQSGGSRYESGRKMPKSVETLVRMKYEQGIDLENVDAEMVRIIIAVKTHHPDLYQNMRMIALNHG